MHWDEVARPEGSILAIAGDVDHDRVIELLEARCSDWQGTGPTPEAPFGGMKASGIGREGGEEALKFFTEATNVCVALEDS